MRPVTLRPRDLSVLREIAARFPVVRTVTVFGSRANGTARRASDLDLAIFAPEATGAQWSEIRDALDNAPLIYQLDVVRTDASANPRLLEKISREGVSLPEAVASEPTAPHFANAPSASRPSE